MPRYGKKPEQAALSYKLSKAAEGDLFNIALYGNANFGIVASDAYRDKLTNRFELIAEQPYLFPGVDHILQGYRRSVCGVHSIYYRVSDDGIEIIRILRSQNIDTAFGEEAL